MHKTRFPLLGWACAAFACSSTTGFATGAAETKIDVKGYTVAWTPDKAWGANCFSKLRIGGTSYSLDPEQPFCLSAPGDTDPHPSFSLEDVDFDGIPDFRVRGSATMNQSCRFDLFFAVPAKPGPLHHLTELQTLCDIDTDPVGKLLIVREPRGAMGSVYRLMAWKDRKLVEKGTPSQISPEWRVKDFYPSYISIQQQLSLASDKSRPTWRNEEVKLLADFLTPSLKAKLKQLIKDTGADPLLLAQDWRDDWTERVSVTHSKLGLKNAELTIALGRITEPHVLRVELLNQNGKWKIDAVSKPQVSSATSKQP